MKELAIGLIGDLPTIRTMSHNMELPPIDISKLNLTKEQASQLKRIRYEKKLQEQAHERQERHRIETLVDKEMLFRFAYVPFVICKLVWDYADTLLDIAACHRIKELKPLCRAVKDLRRKYDQIRAPFIDREHEQSEEDNMYVYEDGVKDIVRLMLLNINIDLRSEYPDLGEEWIQFLGAVYQCDITLKALLLYCDIQAERVAKVLDRNIGHIIPEPIYKLNRLVLEFTGDKPVSDRFDSQKEQYIKTLATQMALIELNDIPDLQRT